MIQIVFIVTLMLNKVIFKNGQLRCGHNFGI
ncbi:hypothetical protein [Enterococcus phage phiFL1C]|uniref:Uncharacterized protein gp61 n=1 Tax=Enterococcus phage phiFL1C TaxID=673834 RepID=D2IZA7_9CAUD|nr:hypothetical protein [Enterococcus phage phiFL1C]